MIKKHGLRISVVCAVIALTVFIYFLSGCNNTPAGKEKEPLAFAMTTESQSKPIRDTVKGAVFDRYRKTVTIKYDSLVPVGVVAVTPAPVDTVVIPEPSGGYTGYKLVYSNNYEKGTVLSSNQCGRCNINTLTPITGTGSFEAWYQAGDAAISSGYRSEQQLDGSLTPTDKGIIIEYDQRFDIISSSVQGLSMQVHGTQDGTSGNLGMWISGGQYVLQLQKSGVKGSPNTYSPSLGTISQGVIYHIKIEVMFSAKSTGYVRAWINGQKKWDYSGVVCDGRGQYPKPGLNLFNNKVTIKTSIDNFRIYNEL